MKKLKIEYGDGVFALPRESLLSALPSANEFNLKVLLLAASDDGLRSDISRLTAEVCARLDCTETALKKAVDFWEKAGVFKKCEVTEVESEQTNAAVEQKKKTLQKQSLPDYTEGEAADVIEQHNELAGVIDACQQILGKMFSPGDVQSVVGIYDYLGLSDAGYIETLYEFCKKNGKASPRYIEKVAIDLHDKGVTTTSELNEYIKRREKSEEMQSRVRELIGASGRRLTSKEVKCIENWTAEWGLDIDVITLAYEVTVDSIGEYKIAYMNGVLENWHRDGLVTVEAVEQSRESYKKKKAADSASESSFDFDEFFEAALARSQRYLQENETED